MATLQEWMLFSEAINQTMRDLSISHDDACMRIATACRNQEIKSQGAAPLNTHPDAERAWKIAAGSSIENLRRTEWNLVLNPVKNTLGRYRFIEIHKKDFSLWLKKARKKPVSGNKRGRPSGSAIDDEKPLAEVRELIKKGGSQLDACSKVATQYPGHSPEAVAERLRKKLRTGKVK